jgi:hypothetical protein
MKIIDGPWTALDLINDMNVGVYFETSHVSLVLISYGPSLIVVLHLQEVFYD